MASGALLCAALPVLSHEVAALIHMCRDPERQGTWSTLSTSLLTKTLILPLLKLKSLMLLKIKKFPRFFLQLMWAMR